MASRIASALLLLGFIAFLSSCETPSSPSTPEGAAARSIDLKTASSSSLLEEFSCASLQDTSVRFSAPGYAAGNRVGLFTKYEGAPPGEKLLRLWWDYENDPTHFQDLRLGPGEVRGDDPNLFDIETVVEHLYSPVAAEVTVLVRAELIVLGKTGNCARNRSVTLSPAPPPAPPADAGSSGEPGGCAGARFCDLGDGSVQDVTTGLVWLRDASCMGPRRWRRAIELVAELGHGQCGLGDGSSPDGWRLPTQAEIESLLDPRFSDPMLGNARGDGPWSPGDAFVGVQSRGYWTSDFVEDCLGSLPGATVVNLGDGDARCRSIAIGFALFWPVRSTP